MKAIISSWGGRARRQKRGGGFEDLIGTSGLGQLTLEPTDLGVLLKTHLAR